MADVHNKATRSYNMSRIKGADTKPEMLVRRFLHSSGLRYRLHSKNFPGRPDITIHKYRAVIFVNGCFWHGHVGCKYFVIPKTRSEWWKDKIELTSNRDNKAIEALKELGWRPIVIWECELKPDKRESSLKNLLNKILEANQYQNAKK